MITGTYPFDCKENDINKLFRIIQNTQPKFPDHLQGTNIQDLIFQLLRKVPEDRITIQQIKNHIWITNNGKEPPIPDIEV